MNDIAEPLITKYRPREFEHLLGNAEVIDALMRAIDSSTHPHAYLLTGVRGIGKTTIARLIAQEFAADITNVVASVASGVADIRALVENAQHTALSGAATRLFLIDECHRLSGNAWDALLAILEEPPQHVYFALCTTDPRRIPDTIKSRCYPVQLKRLSRDDIGTLLDDIAELEGWRVNNDVIDAIIHGADGSARMALTLLQATHDARDREEVRRIVDLQEAGEPLIELVKYLLSGQKAWSRVRKLLQELDDIDFDEAAILAGRYISGVMVKSEHSDRAQQAWELLEALLYPANSFDRKAVFFAAIGRAVFA